MKTPTTRFAVTIMSVEPEATVIAEDGEVTARIDGCSLFRRTESDPEVLGYMDLRPIKVGKRLTLVYPFGELSGEITEVRKGKYLFWEETWIQNTQLPNMTNLILRGIWKGSKNGFLANERYSSLLHFYPIDGELGREWLASQEKQHRHPLIFMMDPR